jgi:hypothetical protein
VALYEMLTLSRVMAPEAATEMTFSSVPPTDPTVTEATLAVDAESGYVIFAYLPIPNTDDLRRVATAIEFGGSPYAAFGADLGSFPGDSLAMRYVDRIVNLLNAITPGCAEPVDVLYGLVNRVNLTTYHRDGDNLPRVPGPIRDNTPWAAMVYMRNNMGGGYLHLPEYDTTLACDDGWGVFFPSAELLHGVTPPQPLGPDAYRYSVLYGTLPGARECFYAASGNPVQTATVQGWDVEFVRRLKNGVRS